MNVLSYSLKSLAENLWESLVVQELPENFSRALIVLGLFQGASEVDPGFANAKMSEEVRKPLLNAIISLSECCHLVAAKLTANSAERLKLRLTDGSPMTAHEAMQAVLDVRSRFFDEMENRKIFGLSAVEAEYCVGPEKLFGEKVCEKFGSEDLEEAALCLSFGRNTACVFHLMRAMEGAVVALGKKLEVTNVEKEWGKILSDLSSKIAAMPKGPAKDQWSECHVNLYHVKQAWRNSTMHPKRTYTDEQAQDVLKAVKSFLTQLETLL